MQTTQHISHSQLDEVIDSIFSSGSPVVKQASSDFDSPTKAFPTADDLREDLRFIPDQKQRFKCYAIYYPEAGGMVSERRIDLKPGAVPGHTHRFSQEGWGLIQLQCNHRNYPSIECRVAVNSDVRAQNWSDTYPEMGSPDLWDWDVIKRHAGRLTRLLRKLAKQPAEQDADRKPDNVVS
ncbi:MAG: hypothetical protein KDN22_29845 [Verrucomicrobiae bacterium]|nr:hypothetical protein [Verrucomicrobiae bacterium]